MKSIYQEVVATMRNLGKYYYTFEIQTENDWGGDMNRSRKGKYREEFYGDYKVDFTNRTAYITLNSNDKRFLNQETYYNDRKVYFGQEGRRWDILKFSKEEYNNLFEQNGKLSLFAFGSYDASRMTTQYEGENIVLDNIYMPKFDFKKKVYNLEAFKIRMKSDILTNLIKIIIFDGDNRYGYSGRIRYRYKLAAVNDLVHIEEPF
ncbi:MAG: hypothetical protein N3I35_06480 [Clostridia bacterium]|nr:hypothetical protein [Clostridia bacterium]